MTEPHHRPPPPRQGLPGPVLALLSLVGSLLLAELFLQLFHPIPDPLFPSKRAIPVSWPGAPYVPSAYPPHYLKHVHAEPGLPGMDTLPRTFSTNNLGYRGDSLAMPKPAGEVRVFVVGGSTTECVFLDDREALTRRLQDRLRATGLDVRVYGAGKSGDRSWDHVAMVSQRIAHLQPDVIVVFAGVNDLFAGANGRDYLMRDTARSPSLKALLAQAATEFQLPRLVYRATHRDDPNQLDIRSEYRRLAAAARARPLSDHPPRENVRPYEENLRSLAAIATAQGARTVFMTQATTWSSPDPRPGEWHWMTGTRVRYREADLAAAMGRYNEAMKRAAAASGAPVFDLAASLPGSADFFYDDVHFNVAGADSAAAMLARFMVDHGVVSASALRSSGAAPVRE
ncbi:MAG: SGNH/GDSL hydrolase family protein [Longimicrobiaceae bacterium]